MLPTTQVPYVRSFHALYAGPEVAEFFGLPEVPDIQPRYNVAPSQLVAVIGLRPVVEQELLGLLSPLPAKQM
jgi:hypothetical protein